MQRAMACDVGLGRDIEVVVEEVGRVEPNILVIANPSPDILVIANPSVLGILVITSNCFFSILDMFGRGPNLICHNI